MKRILENFKLFRKGFFSQKNKFLANPLGIFQKNIKFCLNVFYWKLKDILQIDIRHLIWKCWSKVFNWKKKLNILLHFLFDLLVMDASFTSKSNGCWFCDRREQWFFFFQVSVEWWYNSWTKVFQIYSYITLLLLMYYSYIIYFSFSLKLS